MWRRRRPAAAPTAQGVAVRLNVGGAAVGNGERRYASGRESPASSRIERTLANLSTTHGRGVAWSRQAARWTTAVPRSARPPTKATAASHWVKQSCLSLTRAYIEVFGWCVMDRDETPPTVTCGSKPNLPPDYLAGVLLSSSRYDTRAPTTARSACFAMLSRSLSRSTTSRPPGTWPSCAATCRSRPG